MQVKYNIPIEVSEKKYRKLMNYLSGVIAGMEEDGKFFIKLMIPKYAKHVKDILS